MMKEERQQIIDRLHDEQCSCVIRSSDGTVTICHERGVKDLFRILTEKPGLLKSAFIADKVVGKGAAALMTAGGVRELYTDVISAPALELLEREGVAVDYARCVPNIINRAGTGICPVEQLCGGCATSAECIPLIAEFINNMPQYI